MSILENTLKAIKPVDPALMAKAQARLDILTKPKDSLGRLEEFARRMVAITGDLRPSIAKKTIFTFAGDHGVADEGVSAFPKEVTRQMVFNFLAGGAGINALARHAGADVLQDAEHQSVELANELGAADAGSLHPLFLDGLLHVGQAIRRCGVGGQPVRHPPLLGGLSDPIERREHALHTRRVPTGFGGIADAKRVGLQFVVAAILEKQEAKPRLSQLT